MFTLAHAGITLGTAVLSLGAISKCSSPPATAEKVNFNSELPRQTNIAHDQSTGKRFSWLIAAAGYIDLRFLLLGSILPDIIDKPFGIFLFPDTFDSGRIFCHTLLFTILLVLAGLYLFRRNGKTWLLALAFGVFMHLILDGMWLYPKTLLWPILGLAFDKTYLEDWLGSMFQRLFNDPKVFIPELIGAAILIWFAVVLICRKKVCAFIKYGQI